MAPVFHARGGVQGIGKVRGSSILFQEEPAEEPWTPRGGDAFKGAWDGSAVFRQYLHGTYHPNSGLGRALPHILPHVCTRDMTCRDDV